MDLNKSFEADNGFLIKDGPFYTGGPSSPVGLNLPVSTFYLQHSSQGVIVWRKFGTGTSDWVKAQPNDFYQTAEAISETSTTSTTVFTTKVSLVTPSLPSGDYEAEFFYKWRNAAANRAQDTRLQRNGVNVLTWVSFNPNTTENPLQSGFVKFESISGVQTINLDFKVAGSGTTTFMSEARVKFRRVG